MNGELGGIMTKRGGEGESGRKRQRSFTTKSTKITKRIITRKRIKREK